MSTEDYPSEEPGEVVEFTDPCAAVRADLARALEALGEIDAMHHRCHATDIAHRALAELSSGIETPDPR